MVFLKLTPEIEAILNKGITIVPGTEKVRNQWKFLKDLFLSNNKNKVESETTAILNIGPVVYYNFFSTTEYVIDKIGAASYALVQERIMLWYIKHKLADCRKFICKRLTN